jgi:hypothetical protein
MDNNKIRQYAVLITSWFGIIVAAFITAGCASTRQTNLWMDPMYHSGPMNKILVVAMRRDPLTRRMWEDAIVTALGRKEHAGTVAVASYELFPDKVPDSLEVRQKTQEDNFDGVLLVANSLIDTTSNYIPGYSSEEPVTVYNYRWGRYVTYYEWIYHPGYTETDSTISVRTDLLAPNDGGKMIWSVTSEAIDPSSPDQVRKAVAERIEKLLKKERLIY